MLLMLIAKEQTLTHWQASQKQSPVTQCDRSARRFKITCHSQDDWAALIHLLFWKPAFSAANLRPVLEWPKTTYT